MRLPGLPFLMAWLWLYGVLPLARAATTLQWGFGQCPVVNNGCEDPEFLDDPLMRDPGFTGLTNLTLTSSSMAAALGGLLELGDDGIYKDTLESFSILQCEGVEIDPNWVESKTRRAFVPPAWHERYVRSNSSAAARLGKDRSVCLVARDTECATEEGDCVFCESTKFDGSECAAPGRHCERVPNCKWQHVRSARPVKYCSELDVLAGRKKLLPSGEWVDCGLLPADDVATSISKVEDYFAVRTGIMSVSESLGIAYAALFVIFFICRCGMNQCGGRFGDTKAVHSTKEISHPVSTFVVASIGVMAACSLGFISVAEGNTTLDQFFSDFDLFLDETTCYLDQMASPLQTVFDDTIAASDNARSDIEGAQWLYTDPEELKLHVLRYDELYSKYLGRPDFKEFVKGFNLGAYTSAMLADIDRSVVAKTVNPLKLSLEVATADFVEPASTIQAEVGSALDAIATFQASIAIDCDSETRFCLREFPHDLYVAFRSTHYSVEDGIITLLAMTCLVVLIGMAAILIGPTPYQDDDWGMHLMNVVWNSDAIICAISFVFAGYAAFKFAYWNDVCSFADVAVTDVSPYLDSQSSTVVNTIVSNSPFLNTFNLTDDFGFADSIIRRLGIVQNLKTPTDMFDAIRTVKLMQEALDEKVDVKAAVDALSQWSNILVKQPTYADCTYTDIYSAFNVRYPWQDRGGQTLTLWGDPQIDYIRQRSPTDPLPANATHAETALQYMQRIYSVCDIEIDGEKTIDDFLIEAWQTAYDLAQVQEDMTIDIGIYGTLWSEKLGDRLDCGRARQCKTPFFPKEQSVIAFADQMERDLMGLQAILLGWLTGSVGTLIDSVNGFRCKMYGGFLMAKYVDAHDTLCTTYLQHLFDVTINMWFIPILKIAIVCSAGLLAARFQGDWCIHPKLKRSYQKKLERSRKKRQKKKQSKVAAASSDTPKASKTKRPK
jgi:hypothetical protein